VDNAVVANVQRALDGENCPKALDAGGQALIVEQVENSAAARSERVTYATQEEAPKRATRHALTVKQIRRNVVELPGASMNKGERVGKNKLHGAGQRSERLASQRQDARVRVHAHDTVRGVALSQQPRQRTAAKSEDERRAWRV
jgi:hypothetical protein